MSELRGGPQVNNFDFVSNLDRQMSLVAGRAETGGRGGRNARRDHCMVEVQCIMGNGHMRPPGQ